MAVSVPLNSADGGQPDITNVSGTSPSDVWIVSPTGIVRWNGASWTSVATPPNAGLNGVEAGLTIPAPGDVWVGGGPGPNQLIDGGWKAYDPGDDRTVNVLWATSVDDVWGSMGGAPSSPGYTGHYDGQSFINVGPFLALDGMWGTGTDMWGAGVDDTGDVEPAPQGVFHWTGVADGGVGFPELANETLQTSSAVLLHGIFGTSGQDIWAVGDQGTLLHFDGAQWTAATSPVSSSLRAVWGACAGAYWAVGDQGVLLQLQGTTWTQVSLPTSANLASVWGAGPTDVWIVGSGGTVFHLGG